MPPERIPAEVPDILHTKRLTIRAPDVSDARAVYEAVLESLPELRPWMPWAGPNYSLANAEENLLEAVALFMTRKDLRYHFFERDTGTFVGSSGLHRINWSVPRFEIGYWCRSSRAGQGFVTETVRALSQLAFEDLGAARVEIRCDDRNVRSYRVAERCDFELEGVLKNEARAPDGTLRNTRVYARVNPVAGTILVE